jgi:hypothetical protein
MRLLDFAFPARLGVVTNASGCIIDQTEAGSLSTP